MPKEPIVTTHYIRGLRITKIEPLGHLVIEQTYAPLLHWDELQFVKSVLWGEEVTAIEVFPPASMVINTMPARHLWRLGEADFWPDMLGRTGNDCIVPGNFNDLIRVRYRQAWDMDSVTVEPEKETEGLYVNG